MITQDQIIEARSIIKGKVHRTPLVPATSIGQQFGAQLFLKCENLQKTGSYKPRGGLNKVAHLSDEEKRRGLVVMSAGNLAQGVAFAARQVGVPCAVVMPSTAPIAKINAVKGYCADVVLHDDPATWFDKVEEVRAQRGAVVVDPWGDPLLLAGYATIGMEIVEDLPDVECVVVPVGGGSLIGGIASAIKLGRPSVRVIGVECASGTLMQQSLAAGKPLRITRTAVRRRVCDGQRRRDQRGDALAAATVQAGGGRRGRGGRGRAARGPGASQAQRASRRDSQRR